MHRVGLSVKLTPPPIYCSVLSVVCFFKFFVLVGLAFWLNVFMYYVVLYYVIVINYFIDNCISNIMQSVLRAALGEESWGKNL